VGGLDGEDDLLERREGARPFGEEGEERVFRAEVGEGDRFGLGGLEGEGEFGLPSVVVIMREGRVSREEGRGLGQLIKAID
jgi:hypothetical protein